MALMYALAAKLQLDGYILRSGGANGADNAFETGTTMKEIYLPWPCFNNRTSEYTSASAKAYLIAQEIHPAWSKLSLGAQKLHARNIHQVMGPQLDSPSDFVLCWTANGAIKGGTATAINYALSLGIPVINMGTTEGYDTAVQLLLSTTK